MSDQQLKAKTQLRIANPPQEVFEAIVDPAKMSGYFISRGSGRIDGGKPIMWEWSDAGASCVVTPQELDSNRSISFLWGVGDSSNDTHVLMELIPDGADATLVKVTESGWPSDAHGIARCLDQTGGWVHMLYCLKAYLEYGINLRDGGIVKE